MRGAFWAVGLGLVAAAMLLAGACSDEADGEAGAAGAGGAAVRGAAGVSGLGGSAGAGAGGIGGAGTAGIGGSGGSNGSASCAQDGDCMAAGSLCVETTCTAPTTTCSKNSLVVVPDTAFAGTLETRLDGIC